MKITVIGAGAIGGVIAAQLACGGRQVEIVDLDAAHVAAISQSGLRIRGGNYRVRLPAWTPAERLARPGGFECILLCVKAQHTVAALMPFVDRLDEDGFVVSIQNGLCEADIAGLVGADRTVGGFTNIFADYEGPGVISHGGKGALSIGELDGRETPRIRRLEHVLSCLDRITVSDNVLGLLWSKLAYGAMLTATALTNEEIADVFAAPAYVDLMADLAGEVLSVAAHEGIALVAFDDWDPNLVHPADRRDTARMTAQMMLHVNRLRGYSKVRSGIWRDLVVRKRPTEKHYHYRPVFQAARRHGLDLSLNARMLDLLAQIESGETTPDIGHLDTLNALNDSLHYAAAG